MLATFFGYFFRLNSSHLHLMVHWAGEGSPVIFVLARSQVMDKSKIFKSFDIMHLFSRISNCYSLIKCNIFFQELPQKLSSPKTMERISKKVHICSNWKLTKMQLQPNFTTIHRVIAIMSLLIPLTIMFLHQRIVAKIFKLTRFVKMNYFKYRTRAIISRS